MPRRKKTKDKISLFGKIDLFFSYLKKSIFAFYNKSEFNRGLSIGLAISLIFSIGYTASAAIPTSTDLSNLTTPQYEELFPSSYIKPQFKKFFKYYVTDIDELNEGKIGSTPRDYDLLLQDDNADPSLNFTFFTNKINNYTANTNITNCKTEYEDNDADYCGAYLSVDHTFYKHLIFVPGERSDLFNGSISEHMYFYNDEDDEEIVLTVKPKPTREFIRNAPANMTWLDKINNFFEIKTSLAAIPEEPHMPPDPEPNEPTIIRTEGTPQSKSYMLKGKIEDFIDAELLDTHVFKPISMLTQENDFSYVFEGLTAEPNDSFSNRTPSEYSDGSAFVTQWESAGNSNYNLNTATDTIVSPFYKVKGSKLKYANKWMCSLPTGGECSWNPDNITSDRRVFRHEGPTTAKITFYNSSVANFVTFTKEFEDHVILAGNDPQDNGYHHVFVYSGLDGTNDIDSVTMYIGSPPSREMPVNQSQTNITYNEEESIWEIFIPSASANAQNFPIFERSTVLSDYIGQINTNMEYLVTIEDPSNNVFFPWQIFQPSRNFIGVDSSYLYWENDIYDVSTFNKATPPQNAQRDMIAESQINTRNLTSLIDFDWIENALPESITIDGSLINGSVVTSPFDYDLGHPILDFDFSPRIWDTGAESNEHLFMAPNDSNVSNNDPDNGNSDKTLFVKAYLLAGDMFITWEPSTPVSGANAMSDYIITLPGYQTGFDWNTPANMQDADILQNVLTLELFLNACTGGQCQLKGDVSIPITVSHSQAAGQI